ncbi:MAG: multifunctional oxoglutarate decarboxylase/oxoglutarate dehydrogenase thiamine pyrophosphate-binding subunit/dihydrolipoyllysine-residue succinyltransferase subunit [Planctomycetes bacterium]|nr:multifunctional oxoglutarate decarboxylase/oxoglutarate dehydrogenase thiamine pyrophosphate-binding subunit/dihydrolipoyllysine-residue succinyltransferase subunit [Planctomycetota bacterium]
MSLDFEREYGVNAAYVQGLYEEWKVDASRVDESWRKLFERSEERSGRSSERQEAAAAVTSTATATEPERTPPAEPAERGLEPLVGLSGRIAVHMTESLEIPTATSVRTLPAKALVENRAILNEHLEVRAMGKASFTHLIAFALAKALAEFPSLRSAFVEQNGKPYRRSDAHVNLGIAIDLDTPRGRMLVVPSIKAADTLDFATFRATYEDLVVRARAGKLTTADYAGTNVTLTNPGGFGTEMSVPRLMKGQGLIVATGAIGVPPHLALASPAALAQAAVGPVVTVTSTYDHRVIQGAESGLFLKRLEELLSGEAPLYEGIFRSLRVPWKPWTIAADDGDLRRDTTQKKPKVWELINAYRVRGVRIADLDPLEYKPDLHESLDPSAYGFTVWDLDRSYPAPMLGKSELSLREILVVLRRAYCRRWSVEYMHIADRDKKWWIREQVENPANEHRFDHQSRLELLERLYRAENFERFLHTQYVGNKRFSLEGADMLIPALGELIERAAERGVEKVVIGMAHRGRLNVLANILGKSYETIFKEFEGVLLTDANEGSGDVKYHLGQKGSYKTRAGKAVEVLLSPNPSHLEAVDPVVCGMTRAFQDEWPGAGDAERKKVLAVLIHGDAAFSGQGVVTETLNMSNLRAFKNGGTVHIVVNNQIGFTAGPKDLRSTYYCTDVAKSIQAPVLHANGDYPESTLRAVRLAVDYQRQFAEDAVVDMVCYRRWGHNEGDEPAYTQPVLYAKIRKHPTVVQHYVELLQRRKRLSDDELTSIQQRFERELSEARAKNAAVVHPELPLEKLIDLDDDDPADYVREASPTTGVAREQLVALTDRLNKMPEGHVVHPNLLRQLRRREQMVRGELGLDWGCAEALAFATLVSEGVPIRLEGQDSGRGTFSQRHAVIRDQVTEQDHVPLKTVAANGATFEAWDSLLSEEAALGFEYGYSLARPRALVLWEAQFGDFANGAQIPIDQFLFAGESKWKEKSGVVLLLPHGYDGQGPEHSSARVERFLSLCANGNATIANCTTSAQYFHLLRRQGRAATKRPLVVFTPKSLLRDAHSASATADFTQGAFREVLEDARRPAQPKRIVFSSGKVGYDLAAAREAQNKNEVELVRVEQLYPFPRAALQAIVARAPAAELVWCQEEPKNMGPWPYLLQRFADLGWKVRYAGRPQAPSPATGSYRRHGAEQEYLVQRALGG